MLLIPTLKRVLLFAYACSLFNTATVTLLDLAGRGNFCGWLLRVKYTYFDTNIPVWWHYHKSM
jgi:hypothetical protein